MVALSVVIGTVLLAVGATTVFMQLRTALNRIWKIEAHSHGNAMLVSVKERLLSLAMVLGIGFLLLVSLLVNAVLSAVSDSARPTLRTVPAMFGAVDTVLSLVVITLLFALMFKVLPARPVAWRDVWFGALTTSVLFTTGKATLGSTSAARALVRPTAPPVRRSC